GPAPATTSAYEDCSLCMLSSCNPLPVHCFLLFFFNDPTTTEIYTLSLHDALPISILKSLLNILTALFWCQITIGWQLEKNLLKAIRMSYLLRKSNRLRFKKKSQMNQKLIQK